MMYSGYLMTVLFELSSCFETVIYYNTKSIACIPSLHAETY